MQTVGQVKVTVRPPKISANGQCFDDDRFNIKFVSHFVDIPDCAPDDPECEPANVGLNPNKKTSTKKSTDNSRDDRDSEKSGVSGLFGRRSSPGKSRQMSPGREARSSTKAASMSRKSTFSSGMSQSSSNKNRSSHARPTRHQSTSSASVTEQSELETSRDDIDDIRGMSNSNRQASRTRRRYHNFSSNVDDSQSTLPTSSSNNEGGGEDNETNADAESDLNSDASDDLVIPMLYGQIRQLMRGPVAYDPADVEYLLATDVPNAEGDKETLTPSTVVTNAPSIIDPASSNNDWVQVTTTQTHTTVPQSADIEITWKSKNSEQKQLDTAVATTAVATVHEDIKKEDDNDAGGGLQSTVRVRSEASRKAGIAACARAAQCTTRKPYKTQSEPCDSSRLLTSSSSAIVPANDVIAAPCFISSRPTPSQLPPELSDLSAESSDDVSRSSSLSTEDPAAAPVAARRTTPLYGRGTSPWLTEDARDSNGQGAAAAADSSESTWMTSPPTTPYPLSSHHQHQQQQPHQSAVTPKRCRTVPQYTTSRTFRSPLGYLMMPAADQSGDSDGGNFDVDQTERKVVVANGSRARSPASLHAYFSRTSPATCRPPPAPETVASAGPLASCLKYHSSTAAGVTVSSSNSSHDSQPRRRRIRFAPEVKQRTFH